MKVYMYMYLVYACFYQYDLLEVEVYQIGNFTASWRNQIVSVKFLQMLAEIYSIFQAF